VSARIAIVDTGSANLASVRAAFRRLGADSEIVATPEAVRTARRVVLPGVGAFGDVMGRLRASECADALVEHAEAGRPLLAICLGMQLLGSSSEESPGVAGLGVIPVSSERFDAVAGVPQLGWNEVEPSRANLVRRGHGYFANSFCLRTGADGWSPAWSEHDRLFVAALERGPQLACQFHPELSGAWGAKILDRWLAAC
jgi:imidazole glycerol phosphate synthase glutamine amidotransferase subunit